MQEIQLSDSLVALPKVKAATGLSRSSIYAAINNGTFPAPAKHGRASRWSRREIEDWITARLTARNSEWRSADMASR
jgi:prophage regulatory protein